MLNIINSGPIGTLFCNVKQEASYTTNATTVEEALILTLPVLWLQTLHCCVCVQ